MRSVNNIASITQLASVLLTDRFINLGMTQVCDLIDPYIDAFQSINENENCEKIFNGIHLAFWIMHDERLKLPTDPSVMSNLMTRCFEYKNFKQLKREQIYDKIVESYDNLKNPHEEQTEWLVILFQLKSVNCNLVLSCLWCLLQIWDYLQKQVEFQRELQKENML